MDFGKDRVYEAWEVIKRGYCKIILVNFSKDTYTPILINDCEWYAHPPLSLSAFCKWFIDNNYVYPDDIQKFKDFWKDKNGFVEYRRKVNDDYEWTVMDIIPTTNYSEDNKECILCVSLIIF